MSTPLSLETAEYIKKELQHKSKEITFTLALEQIHEISPHFVEDVLHFLEICDNIKSPSFISVSGKVRNGPIRPR